MLHKVAAILTAFQDRRDVSVTFIAGLLDMPKSSASRLLREMAAAGLLEQDARTRLFRHGPVFLTVQQRHHGHLDLLEEAAGELALLRDRFGHTCFLMGIEGSTLLMRRTLEGTGPIRVHATAPFLGGVAFYRSPGRALLARRSDAEVRALYPRALRPLAPDAPGAIEALLQRLAAIRRDGYAETTNEGFPHVGGLAVAIEAPGQAPLALNICFVAAIVDRQERDAMAQALLQVGEKLGRRFGDAAWERDVSTARRMVP
jgi:DNA-binding IclR family transcriptional regulator